MQANQRKGFSLLELLVVIGLIVLLISITIPSIRAVRLAAAAASTQSEMAGISRAIETYYSDFRAYPGPLTDDQTTGGDLAPIRVAEISSPFNSAPQGNITGSENMVLGLMGGLRIDTTGGGSTYWFDKTAVGAGAQCLDPNSPKRYHAYLDAPNGWLSAGIFRDEAQRYCKDSGIPEFVDQFNDPLPIIYVRARRGATGICGRYTDKTVQYNLDQVMDYTLSFGANVTDQAYPPVGQCIGLPSTKWHGLRDVGPAYTTPDANYNAATYNSNGAWDGLAYFTEPSSTTTARCKDSFILISAGKDRTYGSVDDITNFGSTR